MQRMRWRQVRGEDALEASRNKRGEDVLEASLERLERGFVRLGRERMRTSDVSASEVSSERLERG